MTRSTQAQGELKLCSYTFESCAAAVLQRRMPHIPHVHLVRWFNDGSAGKPYIAQPACALQVPSGRHSHALAWQAFALKLVGLLTILRCVAHFSVVLCILPVKQGTKLCTGGRWRTVQHWVARARMSLHMVEQLDLAGRTGEMVRTNFVTCFSHSGCNCSRGNAS